MERQAGIGEGSNGDLSEYLSEVSGPDNEGWYKVQCQQSGWKFYYVAPYRKRNLGNIT